MPSARSQAWTPHYTDDQLDIINGQLEKWKQSHTYTRIKDIFHDRELQTQLE